MSDGPAHNDDSETTGGERSRSRGGHLVLVSLNDEQYAAVEGWRAARGIDNQPEALGELVRIGLLSEIAKIFRFVTDLRSGSQDKGRERSTGRSNSAEL